jgi:single-stranded-DNA-specific exonuclease
MSSTWIKNSNSYSRQERNKIAFYAKQFDMDPLVMKIIFDRGYRDWYEINKFLNAEPSDLIGPYYLNDMKQAVDRINLALQKEEKMMIFGDYDTDGVTSTSLLLKGLKLLKGRVEYYIPKRKEGYGLSINAVKRFSRDNISLIITVDNGSSAHEAIKLAKELGMEVIVTDHHEILKGNPNCTAFVNPKRSDERFPFHYLAGAGVALKLVQALLLERGMWEKKCWDFFELAAIGTIGDVMPLQDENRRIVQLGIEKMKLCPSPCLRVLFKILRIEEISSTTIAFSVVPIINAVGRLSDPNFIVRIFTGDGKDELFEECWKKLIQLNNMRKDLLHQQVIQAELLIQINELDKQEVIVVMGDFHEGLIGLIASRISDKYKKPSIVFNSCGKGSARSVSGSNFSIVNTIERCAEFLKSFGGHQAAAGLSVYLDRFQHFRQMIQESAKKEPKVFLKHMYEAEFSFMDFPQHLFNDLKHLEPFGEGNRTPVFYSTKMIVDKVEHFGSNNLHVKFQVGTKEALLFFKGNQIKPVKGESILECLYFPQTHTTQSFFIQDYK